MCWAVIVTVVVVAAVAVVVAVIVPFRVVVPVAVRMLVAVPVIAAWAVDMASLSGPDGMGTPRTTVAFAWLSTGALVWACSCPWSWS